MEVRMFGNNTNTVIERLENDTGTSDCFLKESFVSQRYISIASTCLIVYSAIMIIREAFQLIQFQLKYLTSPVNFIEVSLFIFTIMFASVHSNQCYCTHPWQWQVGVIAVFLSWIALVFSIRKLPIVGIYAIMFITIFNNFIKAVVLALLLISAFAFPFYMMFYDPQDRAEEIRTPFITPWRTIIKTIIMTMGEYDMDSLLRQNNQMNAPDVQYPVVSFSLIIVFVVLMPILFLNLLTGLAVGDTDEIQRSADAYRLNLKIEFVLSIEGFLRSGHRFRFLRRSAIVKLRKVIHPNRLEKGVLDQMNDFIEKIENSNTTAPPATVTDVENQIKPLYEVKNQCSSVSQKICLVSEEVKGLRNSVTSVSQEVKDLRSSMDQLLAIVNSIKNERVGGGGGVLGEES
ncbi:PREDICTED: transient receptor potential cation channel subfamily A member 1 homolog isoform X1 [Amphimedon queenslandica]|uniref:Ion transport domain-containing protein n=2 Tax=Amphimedon queenslandica TaxID=400682 RepID=A0AAN0JVQ7_AMPQE|nr:PREDICTED: transient receptor potential cation channel subfamily A member 1 homolog isoform X1 [Amphimedon queenslandica]|eukprot:XP_019860991.1 PREDICTED: transient receptor potential cation channel subfamily A member 1 homolog isoform X1 [Amphimedon queenslandica]